MSVSADKFTVEMSRSTDNFTVIGFDDVPQAALSTPGITTIHQPMLEMGSLAAKLVLDAVVASKKSNATDASLLHLLPPSFVQRDSTKKLLARNSSRKTEA